MKRVLLLVLVSFFLSAAFAKPGYLGIVVSDYNSSANNGARITEVIQNSAAEEYGLLKNDVIISVNETAVHGKTELVNILSAYQLGDEVRLNIIRNGKAMTEKVLLGNKAEAIIVKVTKEIKADGEHWVFSDDKADVIVKSDNTPVAVYTWDNNGNRSKSDMSRFNVQLGYIEKIKDDRKNCGCSCPITQYTFYKIDKPVVPEAKSALNSALFTGKFNITPNPSNGNIKLEISGSEKGASVINIYNINGETVQTDVLQNFDGNYSKEYHLENLPKGTYMMQLKIGEKITSKKFILQ
jgi:ribosomal protein L14